MTTPAETQVLQAVMAVLQSANLGASLHMDRTEADPFELRELPAINLLAVDEGVSTPTTIGMAYDSVLQLHSLQVVVQAVVSSGSGAGAAARLLSAKAAQALASNPTLGGLCNGAIRPVGKQWLTDDAAERPLCRQNTLWLCSYRTHSRDPFTVI